MKIVDPNFFSKTKKVRRIQVTNVPLYLGLTKEEVKELCTQYIIKLYMNDPGNNNPIHTLDLNYLQNSIILELSSVEEANRLLKIEKMEILGVPCKIIRCAESLFGQESSLIAKVQNAQVSLKDRSESLWGRDDRDGQDTDKQQPHGEYKPSEVEPRM